MRTIAVIPARGGSRGIPRKNLVSLAGRPLLAWSIAQARAAQRVERVCVSSDSAEILQVAEEAGAIPIERPAALATDDAPSEAAWLHACDWVEARYGLPDAILGMQPTSPLREPADIDAAIERFERERLDSLLSCCEVADFFIWRQGEHGPQGVNHDPADRKRRQDIEATYLENGSFYLFKPELLRRTGNRLGGRIGLQPMAFHKLFQIDEPADVRLCEVIMQGYGLDRLP